MADGCAHLQHPPKQLEIIEMKLILDSEKERKSEPKHGTHIMQVKGMDRDKIGARGVSHDVVASREGQQKCLAADDPTHLLKLLVLKEKQTRKGCLFAVKICMNMQKIFRHIVSSNHMAQKYSRRTKRPNFEPKPPKTCPKGLLFTSITSIPKIFTDHPLE